jgi:DNA-binding transcriptional regulator YdaS (Cro superfamily)
MTSTPRPIAIAVEAAGGQQAIADECRVSQSLVSQWLNDTTAIHIQHFPGIAKASKGKTTVEALLEDQLARPARLERSDRKKRA